jgi:hypothetical protein
VGFLSSLLFFVGSLISPPPTFSFLLAMSQSPGACCIELMLLTQDDSYSAVGIKEEGIAGMREILGSQKQLFILQR